MFEDTPPRIKFAEMWKLFWVEFHKYFNTYWYQKILYNEFKSRLGKYVLFAESGLYGSLFNYMMHNNLFNRKKWYKLFIQYYKRSNELSENFNLEYFDKNVELKLSDTIIQITSSIKSMSEIDDLILYLLKNNVRHRYEWLILINQVRVNRLRKLAGIEDGKSSKIFNPSYREGTNGPFYIPQLEHQN